MKQPRATLLNMILGAVILVFVLMTFVFPIGSIIKETFHFGDGQVRFQTQLIRKTLRFTFLETAISLFFTMVLGLFGAWIFSTFKFPGKRLIFSILSVPFMLPAVVVAAGFNAIFTKNGLLNVLLTEVFHTQGLRGNLLNGFELIVLAHIFYNTSLVIRTVSNAWALMDQNILQAAKTLGASDAQIFRKITFPMLKPAILSSALLVTLFDFTSYGIVLLLGGSKYRTLEVEISNQTLKTFNLKTAGILSLLQMILTLVIVILEKRTHRNEYKSRKIKVFDEDLVTPRGWWQKFIVYGGLTGLLCLTLLPMIAPILRSFLVFAGDGLRNNVRPGFSLVYYQEIFTNTGNSLFFVAPFKAMLVSMQNAIICMAISLIIGLAEVYLVSFSPKLSFLDGLLILPIGTSAVTLGLGYLIFYRKVLTAFWLIPLAHSVIALPFVIDTLRPALQHIPHSLREAAAMLGADANQRFRKVDLPLMRRAIFNSAVFSVTISMGEFGAASFLSRPERPTLPTAIYSYLSKPGNMNYGKAMAMSSILMFFFFAALFLMNLTERE